MNDTTIRLHEAIKVMHSSRLHKIIRPGLHKFVKRRIAESRRHSTLTTADLFWGDQMKVVLPEVVSTAIYTYGCFDEIVSGMAVSLVQEGDVVIDIGAHFGYFSLLFAHLAGPRGKVLSFEPTPSTFSILMQNTQGSGTITPVNKAVGAEAGACEIADFGIRYCAWNTLAATSRLPEELTVTDAQRCPVEVVQLDQFLSERGIQPDVIKIDAENFENEVVVGMQTILRECKPSIIMETGSESSCKAVNQLVATGYRPYVSEEPGEIVPLQTSLDEANYRYKDILFRAR